MVTSNYNEFKQGEASVDRILNFWDSTHGGGKTGCDRPSVWQVEYRHISFAYKPGQPVLQNLSLLALLPGELPSLGLRCWETTLVNPTSFYDPSPVRF